MREAGGTKRSGSSRAVRHLGVGRQDQHPSRIAVAGGLYCAGGPEMKTDDLVEMLSTNVEPIRHGRVGRTISIAVVAGAVIALGIMLVGLGVRADVTTSRAALFLLLKLAFAFAVVGVALRFLIRLARPGSALGISPLTVIVPFAAIALLGMLSLAEAPSAHWNRMVVGGEWLECLLSIPVIAIVP